jgi:hypothetical protein
MRFLFGFIVGLLVGVTAHWYLVQTRPVTDRVGARGPVTGEPAVSGAERPATDPFNTAKLKEELDKTGRVIREKARQAGDKLADATANARITGAIKAKLLEDTGLSAFAVDVDTTDGVVTLSGAVRSYEQVDRAMQLALETDGVHKVISTLQVKPTQ